VGAKRATAQECYAQAASRTALLDDNNTKEQTETAAVALREAIAGTLDEHTRRTRWSSRSKPW